MVNINKPFIQNKKRLYSYNRAISILTSQGKFHINLGLERISKILELLGNPQENLKIIHVAGTNGKGSTCAMLASVLTQSGYKIGLYTSPHLIDYTERIKINGQDISKEDFSQIIFQIIELAETNSIHITEFEILTALAFVYFNNQKVDFVILETGLGGRLDATNIIKKPLISVITTIDIDHIDRLGNTIEKIAFEKAGIIKEKVPVITLKDNNGIEIITKTCSEKSSNLILADSSDYKQKNQKIIAENNEYKLALSGLWQLKNLALVLKILEFLNGKDVLIPMESIKSGLKKVNWPGRFQYIKDKNIILDGAHNLSGAKLLRESLDYYFPDKKIIWIYSSLNTKDYESIINVLFKPEDVVICTKFLSKNIIEPEIIKKKILIKNSLQKVYLAENMSDSISLALSLINNEFSSNNCLITISGSLYAVGESLNILKSNWQF